MAAPQFPEWAADEAPSLPVAVQTARRVSVGGGWVFTERGLVHDITDADVERLSHPPVGPVRQ